MGRQPRASSASPRSAPRRWYRSTIRRLDQRAAADKAHRAVRDDGVDLVPLHHADIEEAGIFAVHHRVHDAAVAVAVILRRLHEADGRRGKGRHEIFQPIGMDHIVGVEHADDLCFRRGMLERESERAGLETRELILAHELEARPSSSQCSSIGRQ